MKTDHSEIISFTGAVGDKKESKSAWGKVKNMIYTRRNSLKNKTRKSHSSSDVIRTDTTSNNFYMPYLFYAIFYLD